MAEGHKSPLDMPDAVISSAYHHHKRLDGGRIFRAMNWLRVKTGRKPLTQRFLVWIIYRGWQERTQVITLNAGMIGDFVEKMMAAPEVRQVHIAEFWFKGRKSFGVDYDPSKMMEFLKSSTAQAAE